MSVQLADKVATRGIEIGPLHLPEPDARPATSYPLRNRIAAIAWVVFLCGAFAVCGFAAAVLASGIGCG